MNSAFPEKKRFACRFAVVLGLLGLVAGCGDSVGPTGTVQGTVSLGETPYTNAMVVLLNPQTGQSGSADIQADGAFTIPTPLPAGKYTVFLSPKAPTETSDGQPQPLTTDNSVPDKYWNEGTSDISVEVTEGANTVAVQLKP